MWKQQGRNHGRVCDNREGEEKCERQNMSERPANTERMDSEEYTSEDPGSSRGGKEKKEQFEIFRKGRKTLRTPSKSKGEEEGLKDMIRELMRDVKEIKQNQRDYQDELKDLKKENENLKKENQEIKNQLENMKLQINRLEKTSKRNNVIINGIKLGKEEKNGMKTEMKLFMKNTMDINTDIKNVIKMGEAMYKVEMENERDKEMVMQNKSKLKQLKERIYIDHELTTEEQEIQKKIKQKGFTERNEGKRVKIGYKKLFVDGKEYKWDKERGVLREVGDESLSRKTKN